MASIPIGPTSVKVAGVNTSRYSIRFQNVGDTYIYLQKIPTQGAYVTVSDSNFDVVLAPLNSQSGSPETFETKSILSWQAISGPCCNIPSLCHPYCDDKELEAEEKKSDNKCYCKCCRPICYGKLAITEMNWSCTTRTCLPKYC